MFSTRWQPWNEVVSEMNRLQNEMNRVFGRVDNGARPNAYPALNVWEDDEKLYVEAELPGMELSDLEIYVNSGNLLTIQGQRKEPETAKDTWHRRERGYGKFSRVFELPTEVQPDKVEAHFRHGVLMVVLPKREEVKPRRIEVKVE